MRSLFFWNSALKSFPIEPWMALWHIMVALLRPCFEGHLPKYVKLRWQQTISSFNHHKNCFDWSNIMDFKIDGKLCTIEDRWRWMLLSCTWSVTVKRTNRAALLNSHLMCPLAIFPFLATIGGIAVRIFSHIYHMIGPDKSYQQNFQNLKSIHIWMN